MWRHLRDTDLPTVQWSLDTGTWEELLTLDVWRVDHVSLAPGTEGGTYLMGGGRSGTTTTLIKPDGSQEPGFDALTLNMIHNEDLHSLNTGRYYHACSSYWSDERRVKKE